MSKRHKKRYITSYSHTKKSGGRFKKLVIAICTIVSMVCLGLDAIAISYKLNAPEKAITKDYVLGMQTLADGSDSKPFAEMQIYANADYSGIPCVDLKLNYFWDIEQSAFVSRGLQYTSAANCSQIDLFNSDQVLEHIDKSGWWLWTETTDNYYITKKPAYSYQYFSIDDYKTTSLDDELDKKPVFKVQLGKDLYLMELKDSEMSDDTLVYGYSDPVYYGYYAKNWYQRYDIYYLLNLLYNRVYTDRNTHTIPYGASEQLVFEIGDLFEYYPLAEDGQSFLKNKVSGIAKDKVVEYVNTYLAVQVTLKEEGITKAEQSLFNCVKGSCTYNTRKDYATTAHFESQTVLNVTNSNCKLLPTNNSNHFYLALTTSFINAYNIYKDSVLLNVNIDTDYFDSLGITIDGFILPTAFSVWQCNINTLEAV